VSEIGGFVDAMLRCAEEPGAIKKGGGIDFKIGRQCVGELPPRSSTIGGNEDAVFLGAREDNVICDYEIVHGGSGREAEVGGHPGFAMVEGRENAGRLGVNDRREAKEKEHEERS
jgi:hypothetical protein